MFLKLSRAFILAYLFIIPSLAQTPFAPPPTHWKHNYDVQNYLIRTTINYQEKKVAGQTAVTLKPLADGFAAFDLDAGGMAIESVTLDDGSAGKPLQYKTNGDKLSITLDRAYSAGAVLMVNIKYTIVNPQRGIFFIDEQTDRGQLLNPRQVWTHGEPEENHFWFPCYDFPDDKATTEQYVTVPSGEVAIANGEFLDATENIDGTKTFHYKMSVPHSSYLTSLIAGNYMRLEAKYENIPLGYYVYRGSEDLGDLAFGKTPKMMALFEKATGIKFPYQKYDQTIVAQYPYGGMENISATTVADIDIMEARETDLRPYAEDVVAHELAHSWFGDLVTCKTWSQLWLNEGFATLMEAVFRESEGGRKAYVAKVRADAGLYMSGYKYTSFQHPLVNPVAMPNQEVFDGITYQKGSAVLYMLRETIGDQAFWKGVNKYLDSHKFDTVETSDLRSAMEEASGQKLDWFFNQWVYSSTLPRLQIKTAYSPAKKMLVLDVQQIQSQAPDRSMLFRLPLELEVVSAKGASVKQTITVEKAKQSFRIPVSFVPKKVLFDKDEKIMLKFVTFSGSVPVVSMKVPYLDD